MSRKERWGQARIGLYWYKEHTISFQTFFVCALLLILLTWNSSPLRSNLQQLQCICWTFPKTSERPYGSPLEWACQWLSSHPLSSSQLSHNDSLWTLGITKSHREQCLDYKEGEELYDAHLGQIVGDKDGVVNWFIVLVEMPRIRFVLASSDGISSWTPLKISIIFLVEYQSSGKPTLVFWLPYSSHTSHHPSHTPLLPWISYAPQKLMLDSCKMLQKLSEAFHMFLWPFFQV